MEETEAMAMQVTDFAAEMEDMAVWRYLALLLMDNLVLIAVTEEMVVLQWDQVVSLTAKMDMKVG
jgi:hypothetical protein